MIISLCRIELTAEEVMLSSILPLSSSFTVPLCHKFRPLGKSHICFASSPSYQNPLGEESRWLREEQRWLREEQRWLREEGRWNVERQALLQEISSLKLRIQELERLNSLQGASVPETVATIAKLLQVLKEGDLGKNVTRIAETGSSGLPLVFEAAAKDEEVVIKEVISIPDKEETIQRRTTLRKGSEGDGVRAMQEALQRLGFYSGEEDIEYSSFSSGTERAVKTWQSSLGESENGIMTAELLERLFESSVSAVERKQEHRKVYSTKTVNGTPVTSITDISQAQQTIETEEGIAEIEVSQHRVFLLGENRWEEPSRLNQGSKKSSGKSTTGSTSTVTKCLSCRGEGRLLCMECDGTGEPNVESQFLEWVGEGSKCPYCDGVGYIACDVCGGRKVPNT